MNISKSSVTIREEEDCWKLFWSANPDDYEKHRAAVEALHAVQDMANVLANAGVSTIITITWEPLSEIGHLVVRALTSTVQRKLL